jgi:protein-ribulosamine 3-kinase
MKEVLRRFIGEKLGVDHVVPHSVSGGSINEAWHVSANGAQFFCKVNSVSKFPALFEKEIAGLGLLSSTRTILTPTALRNFQWGDTQLLIMEWIEPGLTSNRFWRIFGRQLAELHSNSCDRCGLDEDNYMGSVLQRNSRMYSWTEFLITNRLQPLVKRNAELKKLDPEHLKQFEVLYKKLPGIFDEEEYSLLHGDLWNGNFLVNRDSLPVVIDPAVYYGHRCMDIGMTRLFGGFDKAFYEAYHANYPLPANFEEQCDLCNLYPLLVHLELFGRSYLGQIESILKRYQ